MNPFDCEKVIAAEAKDYASATLVLNPYSEAETLDLGVLLAVYCGVSSPVHGIYLLDSNILERDLQEADDFLARKDRKPWYWEPEGVKGFSSLRNTQVIYKQKVFGKKLEASDGQDSQALPPSNVPDWAQKFSQILAKTTVINSPQLFAETKFQQANTRFYSDTTGESYTYFQGSTAFVPYAPSSALLERQCKEAAQMGCKFFLTFSSTFPYLYERILHEAS